jgi:hypothetical protein
MKGRTSKKAESPMSGVDDAAKDLSMKNERRNNADKIFGEAEARKRGGRTKHHMGHKAHEKKEGGKVHGEHKHHAGRMPRKSGGRTGSNMNPLSSAHAGSPAPGRDVSGTIKMNG